MGAQGRGETRWAGVGRGPIARGRRWAANRATLVRMLSLSDECSDDSLGAFSASVKSLASFRKSMPEPLPMLEMTEDATFSPDMIDSLGYDVISG